MQYSLISGDNHIDLTYCPAELWSSQAPARWRLLVPRVEELDDGLHWFVEGRDMGMWNGLEHGETRRQGNGHPVFVEVVPGQIRVASLMEVDYREG